MNKIDFSFFKHKLYVAFTSVLFYVVAIIVDLFCSIQFFFGNNFFGGTGSTNLYNFFVAIPYISILVIPIFCIKPTGSSYDDFVPIGRLKMIVLNWLSICVQFVAMLLPLMLVPFCVNLFGAVDFGQVFVSFFMILLYGLASCSIGIFFYYLFLSNTISFIFTALVLALSNVLHLLMEYFSNVSLISFVVKLFSFSWHFDSASKGIIDSRDIVYFIVVATFFIFLTFIVYEKKIGKIFAFSQKLNLIVISLILLFSLLNSYRYYFRLDLTSDNKFSVSDYSKNLLNEADEVLTITYYRSSVLNSLYPQVKDVNDFLKEYSNNGKIFYKVVEPEKNNDISVLDGYGITPRQIRTVGNNKTEYINAYSAIVIEYLGKWEIIPFVISTATLEYDLNGRIHHLLTEKQRIVNILCGNGLSLENDYSYVIPWLNSQGFICNEIDLKQQLLPQLEKYSQMLIVIGSEKLTDDNCADIEAYIQKGNKALFLVSPYNVDIENSWNITKSKNQKLIRMLESYGIDFSENIVSDFSCARITLESNSNSDGSQADYVYTKQINYPFWVNTMPQNEAKQGVTLFWPVALSCIDENVTPLLLSSSSSYEVMPDKNSEQSLFITNPFVVEEQGFNPTKEHFMQKTLALKINGTFNAYYQTGQISNANIFVFPDQYFVHSLMLGYIGGKYGDYRNLDFLVNQLLKINGEQDLADLQAKFSNQTNQFFYKVLDEKSFIVAKTKTLACIFVYVPAIVVCGFLMSAYLRKKYLNKLKALYEN